MSTPHIRSVILCMVISMTLLSPSFSYSAELQSPQFKLDFDKIKIDAPSSDAPAISSEATLGKESFAQFRKSGYSLINSDESEEVTVAISNSNLNLGEIVGGNVSTGTITFSLQSPEPHHFDVSMIQEYPLRNSQTQEIPPTSCDGDNQTCNKSFAKQWTSTSRVGLGYNLSGADIPADFEGPSYFRPFANQETGDTPVIITSILPKSDYRETIHVKLIIPENQSEGTYDTLINLITIPMY